MIYKLLAILLALPLLSVAPPPVPIYRTRLAVHAGNIVQTRAPLTQACTFETAPARLQQQIEDPIGYPYGFVTAFSCAGDVQAVIAELESRASAMQAEASAYRQAHPIGGVK